MFAVVACDSAVRGFGFERQTVRRCELRGHQSQGSKSLSNDVGLHVAVVVLHGDDHTAFGFDHLSHHVVDQSVFVPDLLLLELLAVFLLVDLLEDVLEPAVVLFEDGVLRRHVQRHAAVDGEFEAGVGEARYRVVGVVLHLGDAAAVFEFVDWDMGRRAALRCEDEFESAFLPDDDVLGAILVAEGVTTYYDWVDPAWDQSWDARDDDGLAKDGAAQDVADGAVGGQPHCQYRSAQDSLSEHVQTYSSSA